MQSKNDDDIDRTRDIYLGYWDNSTSTARNDCFRALLSQKSTFFGYSKYVVRKKLADTARELHLVKNQLPIQESVHLG